MAAALADIEPWRDVMEVRVVPGLPTEAGGAVAHRTPDDRRWVLVDPDLHWRRPDVMRLHDLIYHGADLLDLDHYCSAVDITEHFAMPIEEARGVFWVAAIEWWNGRVTDGERRARTP